MQKIPGIFRNALSSLQLQLTEKLSPGKRKEMLFPSRDNHPAGHPRLHSRREIIKSLAAAPVIGFLFWDMAKKSAGWKSYEEENLSDVAGVKVNGNDERLRNLEGQVPKGNIKGLEASRMMMGGNLLAGFAHSRDLVYVSELLKQYHTDEKVIETLFLGEECGINTAVLRVDDQTVRILEKYRKRGGKIKWFGQYYPSPEDFDNLNYAIDNGADAVFAQGVRSDYYVEHDRLEVLQRSLEHARDQGIPSGIGAHLLSVPKACEREGLDPDFYMKTLHHYRYWSAPPEGDRDAIGPSIWSPETRETVEFMKKVNKPWIAFKVLAAGSILPRDGLRFAYENGADFTCVGMFDFQVVENSNITYQLFQDEIPRERPWMG